MPLHLRLLGTLELLQGGAPFTLPQSRKTRALLAYLALTGHKHRRERLCEIFWDVPDDPRGALRWSLSKIRPFVDDPVYTRLIADRQTVELLTEALDIDFFAAQACAGPEAAVTDALWAWQWSVNHMRASPHRLTFVRPISASLRNHRII